MRHLALIAWVAVVSVLGCGSAGSGGGGAADEFTLPSGGGPASKPPGDGGPRTLTGVLSFDSVEGGCGFIETADGSRFEVLYPAGWQLDAAAGVLRGPDGERIAAGQSLTVRGSIATGRSSTCQVGPIFQATSVEAAGS